MNVYTEKQKPNLDTLQYRETSESRLDAVKATVGRLLEVHRVNMEGEHDEALEVEDETRALRLLGAYRHRARFVADLERGMMLLDDDFLSTSTGVRDHVV